VIGGVAAAATSGALVAFGRRLGDVGLPFAAIGGLLFRGAATAGPGAQIVGGIVINAVAVWVWTWVFLWLRHYTGWRDWVAAFAVGVAQLAVSWIAAASTGNGIATVLPFGDRLVLAVVLGGALVIGMRFAFPGSQNAKPS
jgi:hypothetical protein